MASINEEIKVEGVYGGVQTSEVEPVENAEKSGLPVKVGFWSSMKSFWLQDIDWNAKIDWNREIKIELTPKQQKVEDELNDFLHQEITWDKFRDFLFQEVTFGKKNK